MFRPTIFFIFFVLFSGFSSSQSKVISQNKTITFQNSPEFWNNVRILPVKFLDKSKDQTGHTRLSATFASSLVVERIDFVLMPEEQKELNSFFEETKGWEEQIDQKEFLKKFKKDFWLTTYLKSGPENIVIGAHQFKNWQLLKRSFPTHPEQLRRSADNPDFWQEMRMRVVSFYAIEGEKAYWMFLDQVDKTEPFEKSDYESLPLVNGENIQKRPTAHPLTDFRVLEQGVFQIQKNTVFHQQEIEDAKARKVLKFTLTETRLRLRSLVIDKEYFINNRSKHFWICFYDSKLQSLVRVVQAPEKPFKPE